MIIKKILTKTLITILLLASIIFSTYSPTASIVVNLLEILLLFWSFLMLFEDNLYQKSNVTKKTIKNEFLRIIIIYTLLMVSVNDYSSNIANNLVFAKSFLSLIAIIILATFNSTYILFMLLNDLIKTNHLSVKKILQCYVKQMTKKILFLISYLNFIKWLRMMFYKNQKQAWVNNKMQKINYTKVIKLDIVSFYDKCKKPFFK
ncbi:hypothetical protein SHELI_v1c11290 [Spiroplasma helicoides]|uniref:Uncharacterized protein n=1 Tax=Spiroplasma helicoides TaxID=216938 RepID=A0A1B3SMC2_9MOLU|nr:hypothetical protein [Spiroplasma helicoides]AOG61076.1 hypothetical protein SHELI_v1c11290 [Spiroplasma helicoides]